MTKIAFGCDSADDLRRYLEARAPAGEARLTTRYCPKRADEMAGGSLYWIHSGTIVGRSPLLGFQDNGEGKYWIRIEPRLIPVAPRAKRAHQGWRYLEEKDAPSDLGDGMGEGERLPAHLAQELERLGLV
jgi:hypothetical protein